MDGDYLVGWRRAWGNLPVFARLISICRTAREDSDVLRNGDVLIVRNEVEWVEPRGDPQDRDVNLSVSFPMIEKNAKLHRF